MKAGRVLIVIGAALTVLSAALAWINLAFVNGEFDNFKYFHSTYGKVAVPVGLVMLGIGITMVGRPAMAVALYQAALVISVIAIVVAVLGLIDTSSQLSTYQAAADAARAPGPERAAGPYAALLGGLLGLVGAFLVASEVRSTNRG